MMMIIIMIIMIIFVFIVIFRLHTHLFSYIVLQTWLICLWIHDRCTYDMMICNLLSPNLHYNYDSITCFFADLCGLFERPNMPTLEDGVRSWPTWLSARSPRNRPQELMRMLETLDSRCWPLLTRLRKPKSLMPKSLTEDLRWWPSSACFSRRG